MAKTKAKKVKKKVSTYDDRLIKIIAVSLAVAVVAIVTIVAIGAYNSSYVCKVGGKRVMTYEYELFLGSAMEEMQSDAQKAFEEEHEDDEDAKFDVKAFWTADKIAEAKAAALEDVREWKAEYLLAVEAGYGMSKKERNEYAASIESNLYYMWYLQYQSYYPSFNTFVTAYLGNMSLSDYQKFAFQDKCIADYRAALEGTYAPTEAQLREKYDSDLEAYRKVTLSTFAVEKPDKPKEVEEPTKPEEKENMTEAEKVAYEADLAKYEDNRKKYEEYLEKKKEYDDEVDEMRKKMQEIYDQLLKDGTYTGDGFAEEKSDSKENKDDAKDDAKGKLKAYIKATLADLAEKEGALFSSSKGTYDFMASDEVEDLIIDDYALSLDWTSDAKNEIASSLEGEEYVTESEEDKDGNVTTKMLMLEDDVYFYITQCTGIKDFDTSIESDDDSGTSVRDAVKADLLSDMSEAELKEKVAAAGSKYAAKSQKQKTIDKIAKSIFG